MNFEGVVDGAEVGGGEYAAAGRIGAGGLPVGRRAAEAVLRDGVERRRRKEYAEYYMVAEVDTGEAGAAREGSQEDRRANRRCGVLDQGAETPASRYAGYPEGPGQRTPIQGVQEAEEGGGEKIEPPRRRVSEAASRRRRGSGAPTTRSSS